VRIAPFSHPAGLGALPYHALFEKDQNRPSWSELTRLRLVVSIENESADSRFVPVQGLGFSINLLIFERLVFVGVGGMASRPRDLADRMARQKTKASDGFVRETFSLPREQARAKAKAFLKSYPSAAYMSEVERWRELPDGSIEFTMRRLSTAD
jgi:hypothetical protein